MKKLMLIVASLMLAIALLVPVFPVGAETPPDAIPPIGQVTPLDHKICEELIYMGNEPPPSFIEAMNAVEEKYGSIEEPTPLTESQGLDPFAGLWDVGFFSPSAAGASIDGRDWQYTPAERVWYLHKDQYQIDLVYGRILPQFIYNAGANFYNYHEREIYLNRGGDIVEFVAVPEPDGDWWIAIALYDEGVFKGWSPWVRAYVGQQYGFYCNIRPDGIYELGIENVQTGQWTWWVYNDSDNRSSWIYWLVGSSELWYDVLDREFWTQTQIRDDWTWQQGTPYRPAQTFQYHSTSQEEQFVEIAHWIDVYDRINTRHDCFYPDRF